MLRKLLGIFALLCLIIPSFAQEGEVAPLIAFFNGELYQLEGESLVAYEACTPDEVMIGQFVPSNDGERFLIMTWSNIMSQALEELGTLGDIPYSPNIWLCDTETNSLTRIYAQPNGDEDFIGELPSIESNQSYPSWSPDASQLAWTQLRFEDNQQSLVVFDVASGEMSETPLDLPSSDFPAPPEVVWTDAGILLFVYTLDEISFSNVEVLYNLDPETKAIRTSNVFYNGGETADFIADRAIVRLPDNSLALALQYYETGWALVDLATGEQRPVLATLQAFSPENPDGIRLNYALNLDYNYDWQVVNTAQAEPVSLANYPRQRIALAPDASAVAYADATLHILSQDGQVRDIANSDGFADDARATVIWGRAEVTLLVSGETAPQACEGAPALRLVIGRQARVAASTVPNNVRSEPSVSASLVGQIPGGETFDVLDGPICADGYAWYQIQYEAINGWTVEGIDNTYFLEPLP